MKIDARPPSVTEKAARGTLGEQVYERYYPKARRANYES
jgi:hypothetical protein